MQSSLSNNRHYNLPKFKPKQKMTLHEMTDLTNITLMDYITQLSPKFTPESKKQDLKDIAKWINGDRLGNQSSHWWRVYHWITREFKSTNGASGEVELLARCCDLEYQLSARKEILE